MGVTSRMNGAGNSAVRDNVQDKLYREERSYRADRLVEKWSRIPEVGKNIKSLTESDARNLAIHLDNQARFMSRLTETQMSAGFQGLSPENMLRLIRLAYPNTIRNKLFTEFAMETSKDSIKYIRPVYTASQGNNDMAGRSFEDLNMNGTAGLNDSDYRKAMYEQPEDRYVHEMANALVSASDATGASNTVVVGGTSYTFTAANATRYVVFGEIAATNDFGGSAIGPAEFKNMGYIDGYSVLFGDAITGATKEQNVLAVQDKSGTWMVATGKTLNITAIANTGNAVFSVTGADAGLVKRAYGRFNSEGDFTGNYLGEVELVMTDYLFKPRPVTIGVTWSQLTELVLDTSFGVSSEELLIDYAGQEIKKALDFRAVKIAYQAAATNPATYTVYFDAEAGTTDESYLHVAQTFSQAIERVGDVMFNDILRGGVSRIVGGPAATAYLRLNSGFTTRGQQPRVGGHQIGEINGIPVFKVPSSVIPDDTLLCVWKNDENDADVSIAFGTLVPFFSTGIIQRKNFYKEAALSSYGDWAILNKRYIGKIKVKNLRSTATS